METHQKPLIIANWKCNPVSQEEVRRLLDSIKAVKKTEKAEIVICPPFIWLFLLSGMSVRDGFVFGSQDCFWENKGAFTGEVSPLMLKNLGCQYVILGHSERRKYFNETDEIINKKIKAALQARIKPILCVGEESRDSFDQEGRQINEMSLAVGEQIKKNLIDVSGERMREVIIAYEPIWAISTENGQSCSPDDAMKAGLFIRKTLTNLYDRKIASKVRIIYGGSVDSRNVLDYIKRANMDGVLVGSASINASEFNRVINEISQRF